MQGVDAPALFDMPESAYVRRRCPVCGCALAKTYPFTYVVQRQGWVKIGGTNNPRRRINELSRPDWAKYVLWPEGMDWSRRVEPVAVIEAEVEHALHVEFAQWHVIGEWFAAVNSITDRVAEIASAHERDS